VTDNWQKAYSELKEYTAKNPQMERWGGFHINHGYNGVTGAARQLARRYHSNG
jgi:hypothetical protein